MDAHGVQPTTWSNLAAHQVFPGQEGLFIPSLVMGARKFSTSCFFFLMIKKNFNSSKYTVILVSGVCTI